MATDNSATENSPGRNLRRRELTRSRLIDAAATLFARQGTERTRINEITELADVGFGSFYNYFESKDAIVDAVLSETASDHAKAIVVATAEVEDPVEVISVAHRHFVRLAIAEPQVAALAVELVFSNPAIAESLRPFAREDLKRAVEAGRLAIPDIEVALHATGGALQGTIRGVIEGDLGPESDIAHSALILRMLGLPPAEADEIARRPFPETGLGVAVSDSPS
jgi:AcrR family transcriptional regulator